jgi:hypothetical protein
LPPLISYVFVVHGKGPAVGGFGETFNETDHSVSSSYILIRNNTIQNIKCYNREVPAAVDNGLVQNDARGAVLQFYDTVAKRGLAMNDDGTYKGNVLADAQIMVAKAIVDGVLTDDPLRQIGTNTIQQAVIDWAMGIPTGTPPALPTYSPLFRCNGDAMHHVAKGMTVIRVEDT